MIRSMTAFARQERELPAGTLSWELRSLNHRYLEVGLRLPDELRALEGAVRERLQSRLGRGKVDCTCRFRPAMVSSTPVDIDLEYLDRLLVACREVNDRLTQAAPLNAVELLRWPGVVRESVPDTAPLQQAALELLDAALDELLGGREREGEQIAQLLYSRCDAIATQVSAMRVFMPEIRVALRRKLETRLAELDVVADPGRLEQELALALQKIDVDEELDRLDNHVNEVRRVLGQREPVGRRLDFLMQELNREANTLGSKSVALDSTSVSVELKVLIEQMREQVQNVE